MTAKLTLFQSSYVADILSFSEEDPTIDYTFLCLFFSLHIHAVLIDSLTGSDIIYHLWLKFSSTMLWLSTHVILLVWP